MGEQHVDMLENARTTPGHPMPYRGPADSSTGESAVLPLALPFTSKLASFWMGLGSLGSRRETGETNVVKRRLERGRSKLTRKEAQHNILGSKASTVRLHPRFIQQSGKSDGCPSFRIHSIPRGMEGGGRDMKLSERIDFTQLLRRRRS